MKPFIKIALTNLGKYNESELIYKWITLPVSDDELKEALVEIGINEEYEEYFISDYDSNIPHNFGEYEPISKLNEIAESLNSVEMIDFNNIFSDRPEKMGFFQYECVLIERYYHKLFLLADNLDQLDAMGDYSTLSHIEKSNAYPTHDDGTPDLLRIRDFVRQLSCVSEVVKYDGNANLLKVELHDLKNLQDEIIAEYLKTL